jgi:hypothetical protein
MGCFVMDGLALPAGQMTTDKAFQPTPKRLRLFRSAELHRGRQLRTRMKLSEKPSKILGEYAGERRVASFPKEHPEIVFRTFVRVGGHAHYVVPEFQLGKRLRDPLTFIDWYYHIVIGRRDDLTDTAQVNRTRGQPYDQIEIVTYDRFLDVLREGERSDV